MEGWVDLGTAGRVSGTCPRLYIAVAVVSDIAIFVLKRDVKLQLTNCSGCCDKRNCLRPLRPQPYILPLDHCNRQRQLGVNILHNVVPPQCGGWESNHRVASPIFQLLNYRATLKENQNCKLIAIFAYTPCLKKTSHLWLAITLTYMSRFWYFLAEMLQLVVVHYLAKRGNSHFSLKCCISCKRCCS